MCARIHNKITTFSSRDNRPSEPVHAGLNENDRLFQLIMGNATYFFLVTTGFDLNERIFFGDLFRNEMPSITSECLNCFDNNWMWMIDHQGKTQRGKKNIFM